MKSPPPKPSGRQHTVLGRPPPLIETIAHAARGFGTHQPIDSLSEEELWVSAIHYCQGVIRSNLEGDKIHFRELDAGVNELRALAADYQLPAVTERSPTIAFRFADTDSDAWKYVYSASETSRTELLVRVAANLESGHPIPPQLMQVVVGHLRKPGQVQVTTRDRKLLKDRDTLLVWLVNRVSQVCAVSIGGGLDTAIMKAPLKFNGVTVAATAFTGIGIEKLEIRPRRALRIVEENKGLLEKAPEYPYRLVPDFMADARMASAKASSSNQDELAVRQKQMKTALKNVISPDLGEG